MRNMTKTKRDKNEGKTAFAARVVTQYGDYISAKDAWERLVDKRGVGVKDWQRFQSNLSDAVRIGLLSKKRGEDMKGKRRVLYGPDEFREAVIKTIFAAPLTEEGIVVDKVQRPNRPSINDIPLGDILSYNHVERDDIMSVIEDLLYDTPLGELRQRYPTLEDLAWSVALDGGEQ
jgi:hypothetical protein